MEDFQPTEPNKHSQFLLDAYTDPVVLLGESDQVIGCNQAFMSWFRGDVSSVIGHPFATLADGAFDTPAVQRLLDVASTPACEVRVGLPGGRQQTCRLHIQRRDASLKLVVVEPLVAAPTDNEHDAVIHQLQAQNKSLETYARNVAHDLKNPISSIIGYAGVVREYYERMSREDLMNTIEEIIETGFHMQDTINALLALATLDSDTQVELEMVDMTHIMEQVQRDLHKLMLKHEARLYLPDTWPSVVSYGPWLQVILTNFTSNAIKYGGEPPLIRIGVEQYDDGRVHLWVSDNGDGLTPQQQQLIFQPYERQPTKTKRYIEGNGLGLTVVAKITERLGAELTLESAVGEGSRFGFVLPVPSVAV